MSKYLTPKQVAEHFNISPMTIRRWAQIGFIPAVKVGNQWRFIRESIEIWERESIIPEVDRVRKALHALR